MLIWVNFIYCSVNTSPLSPFLYILVQTKLHPKYNNDTTLNYITETIFFFLYDFDVDSLN